MEISVSHQLIEAAASIFLGLAAGFLYDVFRTVRYEVKSKLLTQALDLLFWVMCSIALFFLGLSVGNGQQRISMTVLSFIGGAVYFALFSRPVLFILEKISGFIKTICRIIAVPVKFAASLLKTLKKSLKNIFHYNKKWYKIETKYGKTGYLSEKDGQSGNNGDITYETKRLRYSYEDTSGGAAYIRSGDTDKHER